MIEQSKSFSKKEISPGIGLQLLPEDENNSMRWSAVPGNFSLATILESEFTQLIHSEKQ